MSDVCVGNHGNTASGCLASRARMTARRDTNKRVLHGGLHLLNVEGGIVVLAKSFKFLHSTTRLVTIMSSNEDLLSVLSFFWDGEGGSV